MKDFNKTLRSFIFYWRIVDNIVKIAVEGNPRIVIEAAKITIDEFDEKGNWQGVKKNAEVQEETNTSDGL